MSRCNGKHQKGRQDLGFDDGEVSGPVHLVMERDLSAYLTTRGRLIDDALDRCLPPETQHPAIIHQTMRYAVFAGGKRLRPLLVLAGAETCGGDATSALPVACAVELIHTYSLIHDDLPAMDNSDTRRGRPTCHIAFGEAIAVLAGDALHALAFALIAQVESTVGAARALAISREIASAIGTEGMVGGQVLDLLGERRAFPVPPSGQAVPLTEAVTEIHRRKTAALIRASVRAGGILGGADGTTLQALTLYGERVGLAFQIVDDILDVVGEDEKLGKRSGSDAAQAKATYPAAFGVARSQEIASRLTAEARHAVAPLGERGRVLSDLAPYLLHREA